MPKEEYEQDKSTRSGYGGSEESVATDYDDGQTVMTGATRVDEEVGGGRGGGGKGFFGGLMGMARIVAWVDIGFISIVLLILFLMCVLALLMDNEHLELELMSEGTGVFATLMVLMMTLEIWHDTGLLSGTRLDQDPAVCVVYCTFWIVYICSQLIVCVLILIIAILSVENMSDMKFQMSKPEAFATMTLSSIAILIRIPSLIIVGLYLRELKRGRGREGDDEQEEGELTESQLQMTEEQSEVGDGK